MTKTLDTPRTKTRKGKRPPKAAAKPAAAAPSRAARDADGRAAKPGKARRTEPAAAVAPVEPAGEATRKRAAAKNGKKPVAGPTRSEPETSATPVVIRPTAGEPVVALPDTAGLRKPGKKARKGTTVRRLSKQTFLIAATLVDRGDSPRLGVYAVVTRTPGEALTAVRALLGADVPVGLTGKLSGRMARALGLKPGEVRRI